MNGIPMYRPEVQSGIMVTACVLENIAHSTCPKPESTPCNVGEDDPWSPLNFPNMQVFRDFIADAMWQQYVTGLSNVQYPDDDPDDTDEECGEAEENDVTEVVSETDGPIEGDNPEVQNNVDDEPASPPITFKVFVERVFDLPPSQPPEAYVTTPSQNGSASE